MFRNSLFQVYVGAQNLTIALRPASLNATSRNLTYYLDSSNENTVKGAIFVDDKTGLLHMGGSMQIGRYQIVANGHEYLNETECDTQLSFTLLVMPNEVATTTVVTTTAVSTSLTTTFTTAASTATSTNVISQSSTATTSATTSTHLYTSISTISTSNSGDQNQFTNSAKKIEKKRNALKIGQLIFIILFSF